LHQNFSKDERKHQQINGKENEEEVMTPKMVIKSPMSPSMFGVQPILWTL
jgi:hypothetical protein